ncbi:MAG: DUF2852 domain-containing protein [Hyphomicrobiaceae bacterium]|nr:DUF2852 domain-containing protein [Hyphomicrobiaceae bacterium]
MTEMVARLDDWGRPAWIAVMVLGFVVFWPAGLAILGYMIWSGRMGCRGYGSRNRWEQRFAEKFERKMDRWGMRGAAYASSGNAAFDEYRDATLKRLEDEQREFRDFLERLRAAKDRAEFDQFMTERRARPDEGGSAAGPGAPTTTG